MGGSQGAKVYLDEIGKVTNRAPSRHAFAVSIRVPQGSLPVRGLA